MSIFWRKNTERFLCLKKFVSIMFIAAKRDVLLDVLSCIAVGIISPISLIVSRYFTNELLSVINVRRITFYLVLWIAILFFLAILQSVINSWTEIIRTTLTDKISIYITEHVLKKVYELPVADFDDSAIYDKIQLTIQETPERCLALTNTFGGIIKNTIQLVGTLGILINLHWLIGILPIIFLLPVYYLRSKMGKRWFDVQGKRIEKSRYISELKSILLRSNYIKEIKLFDVSDYLINKIVDLQKQFNKQNIQNDRKYALVNVLTVIVDGIYSFGVKLWIIYIGINKCVSIGSISMYINAIDTYETALENILQQITYSLEQLLYIGYICEIDNMEKDETGKDFLFGKIYKIEFRNVYFKYKGADRYTLQNISLTFEKDRLYAVVGINGAGKTTLLKLLMRLYSPTQGYVYINDVDARELNGKSVRMQMTGIFQDYIRYPFTIKENICLNNQNDLKMEHIAEKMTLDKDISNMVNGYETQLSCEWNDGINLSGGQWQKLALSRCLYKNANVCVYDEPFSNIDHVAEYKIINEIQRNGIGKISIIISHQFDFMPYVDEIIVLDNGKIVEIGTHNELIEKEGKYYQMVNACTREKVENHSHNIMQNNLHPGWQ